MFSHIILQLNHGGCIVEGGVALSQGVREGRVALLSQGTIVLYSLIGILLQFLSLTMAILEASELLFGYNRNTFVLNVQCNG